jgi:hypothetical protein
MTDSVRINVGCSAAKFPRFSRNARAVLAALYRGDWARGVTSFKSWMRPGYPSPLEIILGDLADAGYVTWTDSIDEAVISAAGRTAYETEACRQCGHARNVHRNSRGTCTAPGKGRNWHMCTCPTWRSQMGK